MTKKKPKISEDFLKGLLCLVILAFLATTVFLWIIQTRLAENNAFTLLELNITDVREDIKDASDKNILELAKKTARDLDKRETISSEYLRALAASFGVTEINCVGPDGVIYASTNANFLNYQMSSGTQSGEFLCLLEGEQTFVQDYQTVSYDASMYRKYGGVTLKRGGFVQVGYGAERFQMDIDEFVVGMTRNRHVGENGSLIIADEDWNIVSDRFGNEGRKLTVTGLVIDPEVMQEGEVFQAEAFGANSYCMYQKSEGYYIIAMMPKSEAALSRNVAVTVTTAMQTVVFLALFVLIFEMVRRLVVDNIYRINDSLSAISGGELDTVVDVRSHVEFNALSDDINATVDTLKRYIADAAARIDAELAFAKAIQHSALPSVFPPYPGRKEFELWATMHTAKEVGGDFYDFYFLDEDTLAFLVADVSGKGIPAAMFMMQAKTLIKSCAESGMTVEEVFTSANEKLCEGNEASMFVTAWMGYLNVKTGLLTYVNAGHNPPLIKHASGTFSYLKSRPGFVLAGMEGIRYQKNELQMQPGDKIYLYTDGVTEATDMNERLYGEDRLLEVLNDNKDADVQAMCDVVKADVDLFVGEAPQFDDMTMVCLSYRTEEGKGSTKEFTLSATVESISVATDCVNEMLDEAECPVKAQVQIAVAIDEIMSNIAQYAYAPGTGDVTIRVTVKKAPAYAEISFMDNGVQYDPLSHQDPDVSLSVEERKIGGLGIYMVKKSMDEIKYAYKNGKNILTIRKNF